MDPGLGLVAAFGAERTWELVQWLVMRRRRGHDFADDVAAAVVEAVPDLLTSDEQCRLKTWLREAPLNDLLATSSGTSQPIVEDICGSVFQAHLVSPDVDLPERLADHRQRAEVVVAGLWQAMLESLSRGEALALVTEAERRSGDRLFLQFLNRLADDHVELHQQASDNTEAITDVKSAVEHLARYVDDHRPVLMSALATLRSPESAAPSRLLRPRYALVPFQHRRSELGRLKRWSEAPERLRFAVVVGPAGVGKTRLAIELCRALGEGVDQSSWATGFLPVAHRPLHTGHLGDGRDRCVIVDYAEGRTEDVSALLELGLDAEGRLRVLLLMRHPDSPQDPLNRFRFVRDEIDDVLAEAPVVSLDPSAWDQNQRANYFTVAREAFAQALRRDGDTWQQPPGEPRSALELSLEALTAVLPEAPDDSTRPPRGGGALAGLLRHEERYWAVTAKGVGLDEPIELLKRCVTLVVLVADGIRNEADLVTALRLLPEFEDAPGVRLYPIARWLRRIYPGDDLAYIAKVEPDLLAEALIADAELI